MHENSLLKSIIFAALILILPIVSLITLAHSSIIDLPKTGQTASINAGDDGDLEIGVSWPATGNMGTGRFNDNGDGTVTDLLTGLMWTKDANPGGLVNFYTARTAAAVLTTGGYSDWRIPNMIELESLTHAGQANTATWLNGEGFTNVQADEYWSNNAYAQTAAGWTYNMSTTQTSIGVTWGVDWTAGTRYYWSVRGGAFGTPDPTYPANIRKSGAATSLTAGDDGDWEWGVALPAVRFTDRGDGTMYDVLTGLQWTKQANILTTPSYTAAMTYISGMNSGANPNFGFTDWRLPNKKEMLSLTHWEDEFSTDNLAAAGFTNLGVCSFWTSTADPADPSNKVFSVQLNYASGEMLTWAQDVTGISCVIGSAQFPPYYILPVRTGTALCNDTLDNDTDGFTDFPADPGCSSASDDDEVDSLNNPPTAPQLVSPLNNSTGINPALTSLQWLSSTDPDGDVVVYNIFVCEDINFSIGCTTSTVFASLSPNDITYAGFFMNEKFLFLMVILSVLSTFIIRKRKAILPAIVLTFVLLLSSCGDTLTDDRLLGLIAGSTNVEFTVTGLSVGTTYYWKIVADDGNGGTTSSSIWTFVTS